MIIARSFADIFRNNALNNGLLVVEVPAPFLAELHDCILKDPQTLIQVDLGNQTVTNRKTSNTVSFEINPFKKNCLEKGFNDIDYLLSIRDKIEKFERMKD